MTPTPREFAIDVVRQLQAAGFQAFWAGGCVRDELMQREPKDFDVATNALPDQVRELFGKKRTIPIGAAFGVITIVGPRSAGQIEVATFRRDAQYSDGRHPDSVEFSSAEEDAQRRDFTINGMFYDPLQRKVFDYVGGQHDLQRRLIRAIGSPLDRIHEDKLRMLRAIRFAATFDFELDPATKLAIQSESPHINQISGERIGNELARMLSHFSRARACRLLVESDLLANVLPNDWYRSEDWEGSLFETRLAQLDRLQTTEFEPAVVVLLLSSFERLLGNQKNELPRDGKSDGQKSFLIGLGQLQNFWRLTNHQRDQIGWIARHWWQLADGEKVRWSRLQPMLIHPGIKGAIATAHAILGESQGLKFCEARLQWRIHELDPPLLLRGEDLIRLGLKPGPRFKSLLQEIRDRQLDGELQSFEQAKDYAISNLEKSS